MGKVITLHEVPQCIVPLTAVCTGGGFDLFHVGHLRFLRACSTYGRPLVVIVQGDKTVCMRKGLNRPIVNELDRAEIIAALDFVDYVLILEQQSYADEYLKIIQPKTYAFSKENMRYRQERAKLMEHAFPQMNVAFVDTTKWLSTSAIIERITHAPDLSTIRDPVVRALYSTAAESASEVGKASALLVDRNGAVTVSAHNGEVKCEVADADHAEVSLLEKAKAQNVQDLENYTLVSLFPPCINCAKVILESGIKHVQYSQPYGFMDGVAYLQQHGVGVEQRLQF